MLENFDRLSQAFSYLYIFSLNTKQKDDTGNFILHHPKQIGGLHSAQKKFLSCWVTFLRLWKRVLYYVAQVLQKQAIQFIWHAILTCFCFWSVKHAGLFEDQADIVSKLLARAYGGNLVYNHTVWNPRILLMLIYQTFKKLFGPTSSSQKSRQTWVGSYWLAIAILQGVQ